MIKGSKHKKASIAKMRETKLGKKRKPFSLAHRKALSELRKRTPPWNKGLRKINGKWVKCNDNKSKQIGVKEND